MRHDFLLMIFFTACLGSLLSDGPAGLVLLLMAYWALREAAKA